MKRPSLDHTIEFVRKLDLANTQDQICNDLLSLTKDFGIEYVLAGTIPKIGDLSKSQKSNILLDRWPREWINRYFTRNYIFSDPAIKKLPEGRAFRWSELEVITKNNIKARTIMNEATDFGLRNGITIPLFPIENEIIGFSFSGRYLEMDQHEESMLLMLATYATARALVISDDKNKPGVVLTLKEKDILRFLSSGYSRYEIAERMCVTEKGIDWHLRNIRDKMGAKTTAFAIAEAIRLRIIA